MRTKIEQLSHKLQRVHRIVLENERVATEIRLNRKLTPLEFFNLLTQDPSFAWMKPISALIAEIDEFTDLAKKEKRELAESDFEAIRDRVEYTLLHAKSPLAERYLQYLMQDSDLVMAHAELRAHMGPAKKTSDDKH